MPMNPPELLEWLRDFQGIIGALFGSTLTYYVLRGFSRREEQRAKREAWLVIVGELASYSTFAEALWAHNVPHVILVNWPRPSTVFCGWHRCKPFMKAVLLP